MKFAAHLFAALAAQIGGLTSILLVGLIDSWRTGHAMDMDIESFGVLALISLVGLVIIGLPAIFFLSLANQNTNPWIASLVGVLGGLAYLTLAVLQEGSLTFPGWGFLFIACLHGGATGFLYARLSIRIEKKHGPPWARFGSDT